MIQLQKPNDFAVQRERRGGYTRIFQSMFSVRSAPELRIQGRYEVYVEFGAGAGLTWYSHLSESRAVQNLEIEKSRRL